MTFEQSIPIAKQLAENELKKGFDVEAFLILAEIQKMQIEEPVDLVPESNVDEKLVDITNLFITYFNNRNDSNLINLMTTMSQMLSELYHTINDKNQLTIFKNHIKSLQNIISDTNI